MAVPHDGWGVGLVQRPGRVEPPWAGPRAGPACCPQKTPSCNSNYAQLCTTTIPGMEAVGACGCVGILIEGCVHFTHDLHMNLLTVEVALGDREHQVITVTHDETVTSGIEHGVRVIDVRKSNASQVWLKENAWNAGASHLPASCKYIIFSDADIKFCNLNIATETIHALQIHRIVQPFETCADLGPTGQIMNVHRSFGYCNAQGWQWKPVVSKSNGGYATSAKPDGVPPGSAAAFGQLWHPGFCLAMRKSDLDTLPLLETAILGAGDHHMCAALIGKAEWSLPAHIGETYKRAVLKWQSAAHGVYKDNFGYVPGTIQHEFHGAKSSRKYISRWDILTKNAYDPDTHITKNSQGILELSSEAPPALRDGIRVYFAQRNEDTLTLE